MTAADIRTPEGAGGSVDLPEEIFGAPTNVALIHQVVVAQLAAARAGTHKAKTRGEVAGGGRKPYKQKGTGRARQGSIRAPQFVGGGVVHGPQPRSYAQRTPKKMKAAALRGVLSDRAREGRISVVSQFVDADRPSTKAALSVLGDWVRDGRLVVVLSRQEEAAWRSLRNVAAIHLVAADQLSAYDAVVSDRIVFSQAGLDAFVTRGTPTAKEES
jgi:large subunit ribosomal protein L4